MQITGLQRNKNASSTKQRQIAGCWFHSPWVGKAGGELGRNKTVIGWHWWRLLAGPKLTSMRPYGTQWAEGVAYPGRRYAPAWAILALSLTGEWTLPVSSPVGRRSLWETDRKLRCHQSRSPVRPGPKGRAIEAVFRGLKAPAPSVLPEPRDLASSIAGRERRWGTNGGLISSCRSWVIQRVIVAWQKGTPL